ncbi:SOS response-associated peptidase [bacterium]|nr:SOS response-associated peptidase [bacterium]
MCGRYTLTATLRVIQEQFDLANDDIKEIIDNYRPNYNVAPTHKMPIVIQVEGKRSLKLMQWGLLPSWSKTDKPQFNTINAKGEEIAQKPTYRNRIKNGRCLVIADGFYEFEKHGQDKWAVRFIMKDKKPFAFAGLYDNWHGTTSKGEKKSISSFTIITTSPNKIVEPVHTRMPVILSRADEKEWLNPDYQKYDDVSHLLKPFSDKSMMRYYANPGVNRAGNNSADLIEEFDRSEG